MHSSHNCVVMLAGFTVVCEAFHLLISDDLALLGLGEVAIPEDSVVLNVQDPE